MEFKNNKNLISALKINEKVYESVRMVLRPGITERDIYALAKEIIKAESEGSSDFIGDFIGGRNTAEIEGGPGDYVLRSGDCFILDLSVRYGDMWSDTCRTFFLGEPNLKQKEAYRLVLKMQDTGFSLLKSGIKANEVKEAMDVLLKETEFEGLFPHHGGHAIGTEPYKKPSFDNDCFMKLVDGDVVTLEPGIYQPGKWGIRVENDYIVTDKGAACVFDYPRQLDYFVIGV